MHLNQLESYHDTLTKHQSRVITSFEFIEFLHQLKSYIIENSSTLTSAQSEVFIASEQFTYNLLIASLGALLLAIFGIFYLVYLNTHLHHHIRGHYQQST